MAAKRVKKTDQNKVWNRARKVRAVSTREIRRYYLIVCEGTKTEPNYFKGLKADLPPHVLETCEIAIEGAGHNTLSLVHRAEELKTTYEQERTRNIDRLWVVFDRDSFDPQTFNSAIDYCEQRASEIGCAWSNEAFELWYLLHFHYQDSGIDREEYADKLSERLAPFLGMEYRYQKGDPKMYDYLKAHGNQRQAIEWARSLARLHETSRDYAHHNPRTEVYRLVEELMGMVADRMA